MRKESEGGKLIRLVMKYAGDGALTEFLRAFGGRRLSLPGEPGPDHRLSLMLGHEAAKKVCEAFAVYGRHGKGGSVIDVPMSMEAGFFRTYREVERLTNLGWSVDKIAKHIGVHRRTIQRHRAQLPKRRERPALNEL